VDFLLHLSVSSPFIHPPTSIMEKLPAPNSFGA
jgi:hypothetical protein